MSLFSPRDRSGPKVYVVISDVHVPDQDSGCLAAIADLMRDLRPDGLVINGDFLDLLEVSRFASSSVAQLEGRRIKRCFDEGNRVLDELCAAGGSRMRDNRFVEGNHEHRMTRWLESGDNVVWAGDVGVSVPDRLRLAERGFSWHGGYPEGRTFLGRLAVTHGVYATKHHAAAHLDAYKCSVLYGHSHRPQMYYGSTLRGQAGAFGTGHLADDSSRAMSYAPKPNAWVKGFAIVAVFPDETFHVTMVQFWEGRFWYGGRTYGERGRRR